MDAITPKVGDKVLRNADLYFSNTIETILVELLQNARRAGARTVHVMTDPGAGTVTILDDGTGLTREDAGVLLSFGGSRNPGVVEDDETPAGMGFFSLARRGATVWSKDWRLDLAPGDATRSAAIPLGDAAEQTNGMRIRFPAPELGRPNGVDLVRHLARVACQSMPMRCHVDEEPVTPFRPLDRLHATDGLALYEDHLSVDVGDVSIIVARFDDANTTMRRKGATRTPVTIEERIAFMGEAVKRLDYGFEVVADVFGQVVEIPRGRIAAAIGWEGWDTNKSREAIESGFGHLEPVGGKWRCRRPSYLAIVETMGSRTLKARLPDRREFVEDEAFREVALTILRMVARLAARAPRNMVLASSPLRGIGVAIPAPQCVLRAPVPRKPPLRAEAPQDDPSVALIIEGGRRVTIHATSSIHDLNISIKPIGSFFHSF